MHPPRDAWLEAPRPLPFAGGLSDATYRTLSVVWVALASVVRFACVATLPLGNGEAYYGPLGEVPLVGLLQSFPMVAWLVWATSLLGHSAIAVRVVPLGCAAAFGLLFYRLAERFVGPRGALFALVIVTALPVFLVTSLVLNPEAPLAPLWVATLIALDDMRTRDEAWRPVWAGALLGLSFLAKYTALLIAPATLVYLVLSARSRRWLVRPSFWAGCAVALAVAAPVILWNHAHGWPSLQLHFGERNRAATPVPGENPFNDLVGSAADSGNISGVAGRIVRMLVGQAMSYSPLLSPLLFIGLIQVVRRSRRNDPDLFLSVFGLATLLPLMVALVKVKDSEQHWTMVATLPAVIGAAGFVEARWDTSRGLRSFLGAGLGLTALVLVGINAHAHSTAVLRLIPEDRYDPHADIVNELVGWDQVRASLARATQATPGKVVLASTHYSLCGRLMFEMDDRPNVYCPTTRRTEFDFMGRRHPPPEATVLALTSGVHEDLPPELLARRCTPVETVDVRRADRSVAQYYLHSCAPLEPGVTAPTDED